MVKALTLRRLLFLQRLKWHLYLLLRISNSIRDDSSVSMFALLS